MNPKTFLLGVGAQKSGTTWFFRQLQNDPRFQRGLRKEYHVFDAIYLPACRVFKKRIKKRAFRARLGSAPRSHPDILRREFLKDPERYFDHFNGLFDETHDKAADITPTYAGLPTAAFESIRDGFARRDIEVKVVFFMREPMSRVMSSAVMHFELAKEFPSADLVWQRVKKSLANGYEDARSSYAETYSRVINVFGAGAVHCGFYETMFEPTEIERLARFLGSEPSYFAVEERVHAGRQSVKLSPENWQHLRTQFQDRYDFVAQTFESEPWGEGILRLWDARARALLASD